MSAVRDVSDLPAPEELGIASGPFCPLGRGFLSGQVTRDSTFEKGDIRASLPRFERRDETSAPRSSRPPRRSWPSNG